VSIYSTLNIQEIEDMINELNNKRKHLSKAERNRMKRLINEAALRGYKAVNTLNKITLIME